MIPTTSLALILFALFVSPGLLFDLLSDRRRAGRSESSFREASRVVLASLLISGSVMVVLSYLRPRLPDLLADPGMLLRFGGPYVATHYQLVFTTLGVQLALSLAVAWGIHVLLVVIHRDATIRARSAWTQVFKVDPPAGCVARARVQLTSGGVYSGIVIAASPDHEVEDRELILTDSSYAEASDSKPVQLSEGYQQRVIIRGQNIDTIAVRYERAPAGLKIPRLSPARQLRAWVRRKPLRLAVRKVQDWMRTN